MKLISGNHLKFFFVDSRHNLFHWLIVVLIRIIISLIFIPLSIYLTAIGFLLSAETIGSYLPAAWLEKVNFYSTQLPYFALIKQALFDQLGRWYTDAPVWWTMVVGIPLMVMGICVFFINFFNLYYTVFSPTYNRTHCPFCKEPIKTKMK